MREHQRKGCSVSSSTTRSSGRWRCPSDLDLSDAEDGQSSPLEIAPPNGMSQSAPADGTETRDRLHSANGANTRSYRLRRRRTLGCRAARTGLMMYPRLHDTDVIDAQGWRSKPRQADTTRRLAKSVVVLALRLYIVLYISAPI